ncbi:MAG: hypothetical protein Q4G33_09210 [bacterium]|nr:hypothetical protein [bacterium]
MKKLQSSVIIKFLSSRNNLVLWVILIIGVILMASVSGNGSGKKEVHTAIDTAAEETRLEEILSRIDGAGEVKVMVTYYGGTEQSIAYETKSDTDKDSHQEDKRAVMSGSSPMVVQELYPRVKGVIVAAQGAGDISVKRKLTEAVTAVMGVGASRVKVYKSE